jgi:iron(III) transport system ATP-binding protein
MPLIILDGVTKRYQPGDPPAVDGLSLSVEPGEILALLGPSGCGKTTTLRLIIGFEAPDAGRIEVAGRVVADARQFVPPESRGIGMVFQDYALFPHLTVAQNIAFGIRKLSAEERTRRTQRALQITEMEDLADRYPHELSGGQQQRVALARAMAPGYEAVLLDEPLSNLDADLRAQLRGQLRRVLKKTQKTAILVTHDQDEAFQIADRVGVLNQGRLEQVGTPEEIYQAPASRFVADFVGAADFIPGTVLREGIRTDLGLFVNPNGIPIGSQVDVMIRPDEVTIAPDPDGPAVVTERLYLGADKVYTLRLASEIHIRSNQHATPNLPIGARVSVNISPSHVVTFASEKRVPQLARGSASQS